MGVRKPADINTTMNVTAKFFRIEGAPPEDISCLRDHKDEFFVPIWLDCQVTHERKVGPVRCDVYFTASNEGGALS